MIEKPLAGMALGMDEMDADLSVFKHLKGLVLGSASGGACCEDWNFVGYDPPLHLVVFLRPNLLLKTGYSLKPKFPLQILG